jgi:hypothetical protein
MVHLSLHEENNDKLREGILQMDKAIKILTIHQSADWSERCSFKSHYLIISVKALIKWNTF